MIIHLLYYHATARLDSETFAAPFSESLPQYVVNNSCVLEISCCRGTRKTGDVNEQVIFCDLSRGNVEFVEHNG